MNRLEVATKDFFTWKNDTDTTKIMYSKEAHECIAWILYEQVADMVSSTADSEEIAEFSRSIVKLADEVIEN